MVRRGLVTSPTGFASEPVVATKSVAGSLRSSRSSTRGFRRVTRRPAGTFDRPRTWELRVWTGIREFLDLAEDSWGRVRAGPLLARSKAILSRWTPGRVGIGLRVATSLRTL